MQQPVFTNFLRERSSLFYLIINLATKAGDNAREHEVPYKMHHPAQPTP